MQLLAGIRKFTLRARVLSKSILNLFIHFLEIVRDNLTSTSVKVVPLTFTSSLVRFAPDNMAVWLRYNLKTTDLTTGAYAHFCILSTFCW